MNARRRRRIARAAVAVTVTVTGLSGCAAPRPEKPPQPAATVAPGAAESAAAQTALDAELLYELLLADLAAQRGQGALALEAATRATYRSRDRRVAGAAVRLGARLGAHAQVIELAQFLARLDPADLRNLLTLADAQLKTGQLAQALTVLTAAARRQTTDDAGARAAQSIASLLAESAADAGRGDSADSTKSAKSPDLLAQFDAAAAPWPANAPLRLTGALLALALRRGADFQRRIDQTLRLRPRWSAAAEFKLDYLAARFPVQAARFAAAFLRAHPGAHRFRTRYAGLLLEAGQFAPAAAELDAVLRQAPQNSEALFAAAGARFEMAQFATALQLLRRYLALNPRSDRARMFLADIHLERAEFDAAAEALREVASPAYHLDAQIALADVLARRDGAAAGIRHLRQIATRGRDEGARIVLEQARLHREFGAGGAGDAGAGAGDGDGDAGAGDGDGDAGAGAGDGDAAGAGDRAALAALGEGLARFPAHPDLLYQRGLLAAQLGLLDLHERDMRQLIKLQPDNAHAYNALGYTLADQTERLDEAFTLIAKGLKLRPNDPFILDSMGWVHFRRGDTTRAIDYLQRALAVREDAEIAAHLGEALWAAGRYAEARAIWAKGMEWGPDNATLLDTLRRFSGGAS